MHCDRELNLNQGQIDEEFTDAIKARGFEGDITDFDAIIDFLIDKDVVGWREAPTLELDIDC